MNMRTFLLVCTMLFLNACVQQPVFKVDGYALIKSNYPIVSANGAEIEHAYRLEVEEGENTLTIVYNTYQHDYFCTFKWTAVANTVYEVTDQENRYPLTLYRWVKTNSLWASRLDPVDPLECINKPRSGNTTDG